MAKVDAKKDNGKNRKKVVHKSDWQKLKKAMDIKPEDYEPEVIEPEKPAPIDFSKSAKYETHKFKYKIA